MRTNWVQWSERQQPSEGVLIEWLAECDGQPLSVQLSGAKNSRGEVVAVVRRPEDHSPRAVHLIGTLEGIQHGRSAPRKDELRVIRKAQRWCEQQARAVAT